MLNVPLPDDPAAQEALDVVQEQQFGMAPAVLGFRLKRLNQGPSATLRGKRMAQELLALMSQPLSGRDSDAVTDIEGQLATQRADGGRIAADPRRLDSTFWANFSGQILAPDELHALLTEDKAAVVIARQDTRLNKAAGRKT